MLTVIEPNTKKDLTTLANVKAEMEITSGEQDRLLARFITQASEVVAEYCNRVFQTETVVDTFRVRSGSAGLCLSRYPVSEVISVMDGDTVLTADDFDIDMESGIVEYVRGNCTAAWPAGRTRITYKAGYSLPNGAPAGLERATILLVKQYAASGDRDPMIRSEAIEGAGSTDYFSGGGTGFPPEVEGLLEPHRKGQGA